VFLMGLVVSPGLQATYARAGTDAGPPNPRFPAGCLDDVERVADASSMGMDKRKVMGRLERAAGSYQAFARLRPGAEATECGRRLAELTRDLGVAWYAEDRERRPRTTNATVPTTGSEIG
jgi:hypothetical protein